MAAIHPTPSLSPAQRSALSRALTRTFLGWLERMIANGQNPFAETSDAFADRGGKEARAREARKRATKEPGR